MQHVIFIHGAFYDRTVWDQVSTALLMPNRVIHCPPLTGDAEIGLSPNVGLFTHVDDVKNLVDGIFNSDPAAQTILVGHRYGGMVITEVAAQMPDRINHLIYLDSVVPMSKESLVDILGHRAKKLTIVDGWKVLTSLKDLGLEQPSDIQWAKTNVFPQSLKCFTEKRSAIALAPSIAKTYILCTLQDDFTKSQAERVKQMGGQIRKIQTSSSPMITNPELLISELRVLL